MSLSPSLALTDESRRVGGDEQPWILFDFRLLAAGLGKSRQVGDDEQSWILGDWQLG